MKEPVLLGIDVGTTFCKAAIVSADAELYPRFRPVFQAADA